MSRNKQEIQEPPFLIHQLTLGFQARIKTSCFSLQCLAFAFLITVLSGCAATVPPKTIEKIEGISLESPANPSEEDVMTEILAQGASHVCLMPYAFVREDDPVVSYERGQWWGERIEGIRTMAIDARTKGLQVMIKPHLWIDHGSYTGDLSFKTAQDQSTWETSYSEYILTYARLAEELKVEMFCIGTELCTQVQSRPAYWKGLIASVRDVYSGKVTYASNWDCYPQFPLWSDLDLIGVDAYFPLEHSKEDDSTKKLWDQWKVGMKSLSDSLSIPILFTEYGYRSVSEGLIEPWQESRGSQVDMEIQCTGYRSLFEEVWNEDWFAGGFLWKWHCKEHLERGDRSPDFTPQGKPALELIQKEYGSQSLRKAE